MRTIHPHPPTGWKLWLAAARPRTLSISVAPVIVGTALAWPAFDSVVFAITLAAALLIQAGTNLWNDVGDAQRGADLPMRLGPPRVTALGWASPARVRRAAIGFFGLALLCGLFLAWRGGWPIAWLGLASLVAGWAYSGGKRPISYTPLGEVFVVAFFGIGAICGTLWLQAGTVTVSSVMVGAAFGLPAAAVLMANNYRDTEADTLSGRRTLAIILGRRGSLWAYGAMMLAAFALLAVLGHWLVLLALPEALRLIHRFRTQPRSPEFNRILAHTARCQLLMAVLFVLGGVL